MRRWLSQAAFENENERRTARVLILLVLASWAGFLILGLVAWRYHDWRTLSVMGGAIVLQLAPLWLVRPGHLQASAYVFVMTVLVAVTGLATVGQGIRDLAVVAYPIVFVFAGLTLGRRLFVVSVGLTLAATCWLAIGEANGWFVTQPPLKDPSNRIYLLGVIVVLLVAAVAVHLLATSLRRSLSYARRELVQRKQAEKELRESESRLSAVFNTSPVGISVTRMADGRILDINESAVRLFGYTRDEAVGRTTVELGIYVNPADRENMLQQVRLNGSCDHLPVDFRRRSRELGTMELSNRLLDVDGEQCLLGMIVDITEQKAAEEALRHAEEQLHQSQKMEAVGQLAGGIAHDFNNLLTAILGYSDLILLDGSSTVDEVRPDLEEIKRAGERARALTQQILAFSRRQALRPQVVVLDKVIRGLEPLLRRTIGEDIHLQITESPGLAPVEVDPHQFEQVVMNLVINARDAMPSGGRLTVETANVELDEEFCRTHADAVPGSYVVLRVSDTGVGMDAATQERIFEPFFTTKAFGAGTGLGLATVYGIVKQSGGTISVTSEPGRGSSFALYLPRGAQPEVSEEMPIPSQASARGDETIMVVEDEEALRGLIERVLRGAGYQTLIFASAPEALAALEHEKSPIDLLLTDVMLPGPIQGHDLARTILASQPGLPVLYISGYSRDALVHAGRLDEGVNLLEKPFTPKSLTDAVREVLERQ